MYVWQIHAAQPPPLVWDGEQIAEAPEGGSQLSVRAGWTERGREGGAEDGRDGAAARVPANRWRKEDACIAIAAARRILGGFLDMGMGNLQSAAYAVAISSLPSPPS